MTTSTTANAITSCDPVTALAGQHAVSVHASDFQGTVHRDNDHAGRNLGYRDERSGMQAVASQYGEPVSLHHDRADACEGEEGGSLGEICQVSRRLDVDYDVPDPQREV